MSLWNVFTSSVVHDNAAAENLNDEAYPADSSEPILAELIRQSNAVSAPRSFAPPLNKYGRAEYWTLGKLTRSPKMKTLDRQNV
jgi:hypothetical protein